jgi:signal transduction histidine kinase/HAMP domain-containing protein
MKLTLTSLSIKRKLIAIILFSAISALMVGFLLIIVLNVRLLKREMVDNSAVIARVVGDYSVSALSFQDQREAADILKKLEGMAEVQSAHLFTPTNTEFAHYESPAFVAQLAAQNSANGSQSGIHGGDGRNAVLLDTTTIPPDGHVFKDEHLLIYQRIYYNAELYGTIVLQLTTVPLQAKIRNYILTMVAAAIGLVLISVLLALRLQRVISEPLMSLTSLVQKLSREGDYSMRFAHETDDEIGILADGFNELVARIQTREAERNKAQDALARALREDFRETVRNLQNLIYKISRRDETYVFTLFEGKLSININSELIIGKTIAEVFGRRNEAEYIGFFDRAFAGEAVQFEMLFDRRYYLNALEPIVENGTVREIVGSAVDITEQKLISNSLRVSEQRYKALVEGLPVGIIQSVNKTTVQGNTASGAASAATGDTPSDMPSVRIEFVNSDFVRQTNTPLEVLSEMMSQPNYMLPRHPDDKELAELRWNEWIQSAASVTLYRTYRLKTGIKTGVEEFRWFDDYATKFSIESGETIIIQAFLDVTEKKTAEDQLQQSLAKERELNALKSRFVSTVSHEFRTPLTGILLSVDLLQRYFAKLTERQRNDELGKVRSRVAELTNLMNDFLAQSESESIAQKFKPVPVDVIAICSAVISDMESVAHAGHKGQVERRFAVEEAFVLGDTKLLTHVFRNLVSNAIKYSPATEEQLIALVVMSIEVKDGMVLIDMTDHGIGIPDEDLQYLFTPFFRASNTGKISGTGVGLSIVREFAELHGGSIGVRSIVGIGSTFTVRLPLLPADAVAAFESGQALPEAGSNGKNTATRGGVSVGKSNSAGLGLINDGEDSSAALLL